MENMSTSSATAVKHDKPTAMHQDPPGAQSEARTQVRDLAIRGKQAKKIRDVAAKEEQIRVRLEVQDSTPAKTTILVPSSDTTASTSMIPDPFAHLLETSTSVNQNLNSVFLELLEASKKVKAVVEDSSRYHNLLQEQILNLREDLRKANLSKDTALEQAAELERELKTKMDQHAKEMAKEKAERAESLRKVRESLKTDHNDAIHALTERYEKEKMTSNTVIDAPRELRQANQKLIVENNALKKKVVNFEEMKTDIKKFEDTLVKGEQLNSLVRKELTKTKQQLVSESIRASVLCQEKLEMEQKVERVDELLQKIATVEAERHDLSTRCIWLKIQWTRYQDDVKILEAQIDALVSSTQQLELASSNEESLVEIGKAIRRRFLVKFAAKWTGIEPNEEDIRIIEEGNKAAHGGNGVADEALWLLDGGGTWLERVYLELYNTERGTFSTQQLDLQVVRNCYATLQVVKRPRGQPSEERSLVDKHIRFFEDYKDYDPDIYRNSLRWLPNAAEAIQKLTDNIVKEERFR